MRLRLFFLADRFRGGQAARLPEERRIKMCAEGFDFKTAAGLHRDRLAEAESIRRARQAKMHRHEENKPVRVIRRKLGEQLIALGERISA